MSFDSKTKLLIMLIDKSATVAPNAKPKNSNISMSLSHDNPLSIFA